MSCNIVDAPTDILSTKLKFINEFSEGYRHLRTATNNLTRDNSYDYQEESCTAEPTYTPSSHTPSHTLSPNTLVITGFPPTPKIGKKSCRRRPINVHAPFINLSI